MQSAKSAHANAFERGSGLLSALRLIYRGSLKLTTVQ